MVLKISNKTWVTSDSHFGHQNIIKFQQRPVNHELIMLSEWIKFVGERDQVFHLGDVFMGKTGNPRRWATVLSRLPGEKFMLRGNHDGYGDDLYETAGFTIIDPFVHAGIAFTHRPISSLYPYLGFTEAEVPPQLCAEPGWQDTVTPDWHTNIHGHIHGNSLDLSSELESCVYDRDKTYINVSVEATDYKPRQLGSLIPGGVSSVPPAVPFRAALPPVRAALPL